MVHGGSRLRLVIATAVVLLTAGCTHTRPAPRSTSSSVSAVNRASSPAATNPAPTGSSTQAHGLPGVIWECTSPPPQSQQAGVEPRSIVLTCADNGTGVEDVVWTSWTASAASGSGRLWQKDCVPDCASGGISHYAAVITLDRPVRTAKGLLFSRLIAKYTAVGPGGHASDQFRLPLPPE